MIGNLDHVDAMIPLEMDLSEIILIQEVIDDNQAPVVIGEEPGRF